MPTLAQRIWTTLIAGGLIVMLCICALGAYGAYLSSARYRPAPVPTLVPTVAQIATQPPAVPTVQRGMNAADERYLAAAQQALGIMSRGLSMVSQISESRDQQGMADLAVSTIRGAYLQLERIRPTPYMADYHQELLRGLAPCNDGATMVESAVASIVAGRQDLGATQAETAGRLFELCGNNTDDLITLLQELQ